MSEVLAVRRVVTGHDTAGRAVVTADETITAASPRPGQQACALWATDRVPADSTADFAQAAGARVPGGAAFRIVRYAPGAAGNMHRTQTLDWGVVLAGSIVLELDEGAEVELAAGDVLVQRGTVHRWSNRGDQPCTIAFVLLDASPG